MGKWKINSGFSRDRGPDPILEYDRFVRLFDALKKPAFSLPICELMLDQQYFNGMSHPSTGWLP
jgi:hypothetical protein